MEREGGGWSDGILQQSVISYLDQFCTNSELVIKIKKMINIIKKKIVKFKFEGKFI